MLFVVLEVVVASFCFLFAYVWGGHKCYNLAKSRNRQLNIFDDLEIYEMNRGL